jgi:Mg2+ and Co2+ transporter CorA
MATEVLELSVKTNIGEVTKETKELTNEASSAVGEFRFMGVSLNGVKKAFASAAVTAKGMFASIKAGLISTGIGAFLVLIGSLVAYFTSTKDGAEKLERAMAGFGAVVSVITDRLSTFGEVIVSAFENPQQAVKDLWEAIKTNIVNRVEGLFDVFGALGDTIKAAFNLDWEGVKAGAADFTESMIQTATGVDDLTGKMAEGFKSLGDEIEKDVAAAMRLKGMLQQLKDEEREFSKVKAQTRQDIQKARLDALDESKTTEERLAAVQKANDLELKTTEDVLKMQRRKIEVQKATMALSENMAEDLDELASLEVELIDLQTASFQTQKRLATEMETLTNEIAAKEKEAQKVIDDEKAERRIKTEEELKALTELQNQNTLNLIDDLQERALAELKIQEEKELASIKGMENFEAMKVEIDKKYSKLRGDVQKKADQEEKDRKKALQSFNVGMAQQGLGIIADAAGEGTALAKAAAIAQATISGVQGVQNAFTSANANVALTASSFGAYPVTMAALAGVFAAANIAKIASGSPASPSDAPPPPSTTTPAPQMMSGAFQLGGGVKPEPMKAFVVTDEMSNSQSQLANIRRRATI